MSYSNAVSEKEKKYSVKASKLLREHYGATLS